MRETNKETKTEIETRALAHNQRQTKNLRRTEKRQTQEANKG